jgi:hypothetical protein
MTDRSAQPFTWCGHLHWHAGNMKFNTHNEESVGIHVIVCVIL